MIKYYFEVNKDGDPIQGSNIKAVRPPRGLGAKRYKEYTPLGVACCDEVLDLEKSENRKWRYYVRLNDDNLPVSGSLRKAKNQPPTFHWQEVVGIYCCSVAPTIDNLSITSSSDPITGNVITDGNAVDPQASTITVFTIGTYEQDGMTLEIEANGDYTITQDNNDENSSTVFNLQITDGKGNKTSFTLTVDYTAP